MTSERQRPNVHGAIDLEIGKTAMIDVETVDAASTMRSLQAIEAMSPLLAVIHVFSTMRAITMLKSCGGGWLSPEGGSGCISFPPTARI
jgi:hypothetical protein